jgi:hypothetical protein
MRRQRLVGFNEDWEEEEETFSKVGFCLLLWFSTKVMVTLGEVWYMKQSLNINQQCRKLDTPKIWVEWKHL